MLLSIAFSFPKLASNSVPTPLGQAGRTRWWTRTDVGVRSVDVSISAKLSYVIFLIRVGNLELFLSPLSLYITEYVIHRGDVLHTNGSCVSYKSLVYAHLPKKFQLERGTLFA